MDWLEVHTFNSKHGISGIISAMFVFSHTSIATTVMWQNLIQYQIITFNSLCIWRNTISIISLPKVRSWSIGNTNKGNTCRVIVNSDKLISWMKIHLWWCCIRKQESSYLWQQQNPVYLQSIDNKFVKYDLNNKQLDESTI